MTKLITITLLLSLLTLTAFAQESSRQKAVGSRQLQSITVDYWCSEQQQLILVSAFQSLGFEVAEHPRKDGDPLAVVGRLYLACESFEDGSIILYVVTPGCDTNGEFELTVLWKSERVKPEEAVKAWLKWRER